MRSRVIVSAASISSRWADVRGNLGVIARAAQAAAKRKARLLLLPECCLTGANWPTNEKSPTVDEVALELDSPPVREVQAIARQAGLVLAVGLWERRPGGPPAITQALVGSDGLIGAYRKVHEGRYSSREADLFPIFDLGFARVGLSICYDNCFPEHARILALRGAELVVAPFCSLPLSRPAWRLERLVPLRARAQDNRVFVLSASHALPHVAGRPGEWGYSGICCAIDPLGRVLAESRGRCGRPQQVTVTLDAKLLRTYLLGHVPSMRSRRPVAYAALSDEHLQREYLAHAARFEYNEQGNVWTAPPQL